MTLKMSLARMMELQHKADDEQIPRLVGKSWVKLDNTDRLLMWRLRGRRKVYIGPDKIIQVERRR